MPKDLDAPLAIAQVIAESTVDDDTGHVCTLSQRHIAILSGRWPRTVAAEQRRLVAAGVLAVASGGQGQLEHQGLGTSPRTLRARAGTTWAVDEAAMSAELARLQQASPGWQVLTAVDAEHPRSLAELAKAVGTDRRTAGRLLRELGQKGAVRRTDDGLQVVRWSVARAPSLALWRTVLGDWLAQDRALTAYEATRAGRRTEGIEELAREDEAWLANDLPQVLRKLRRLGVEEDGKAVLDAVMRAYRHREKVA